ncbi:MAG: hypothetical protein WAV15_03200 [Minisyncoccia bacterium]
MKNLATLLKKGDLTPKERMLFLVHDAVSKDKTGKEILTEADRHALSEGWKPLHDREVDEYNRYNKGWRTEGSLRLDAQTTYLNAQVSLLRSSRLLDYAMWSDSLQKGNGFGKIHLYVDENEALDLILKNTGLRFDQFLHSYTFQKIDEDLKKDILALYEDAGTESQYLDQEEIIADLFNGTEQLTVEAKEKLADIIADVPHNRYAELFKEKGMKSGAWWFYGYFAELPTLEIAKRWADENEISYDANSETLAEDLSLKIQDYAEKNKVEVRELLRRTIRKWLDEGLFEKKYVPLCNSADKTTCNDSDTKLPHMEILKRWLKAKDEAEAEIQKLIDAGQLKVEVREKEIFESKESMKIITGESLYNLQGGFDFAQDFKNQVEGLKPLDCLILFLRNGDFLKGYASLLAFADIYKKLSRLYEIDLGYKIDGFINDFKKSIEQLNDELRYLAEKLEGNIYRENNTKFLAEVFMDRMLIRLEDIEPGTDETEMHYAQEFEKIFLNLF